MTDAVSVAAAPARLTTWTVLRGALSVARAEPGRVFGIALVVFAPFAAVEAAANLLAEQIRSDSHLGGIVAIALLPATTAAIWGSALFAGGLERTIGAHRYGGERHGTLALLRGLPIGRLVLADLALGAVVFVGYAAFVLPGILAFTLFALAGPMVTIEGRRVIDAFHRSASLVLQRPWLVFSLVTVPVVVEEAIFHELEEYLHAGGRLGTLLGAPVVASLLGAAIGLVEVTLAYELIRLEPRVQPRPAIRRRMLRHAAGALLGIVIVVATFAFILPRIADYSQVWGQITALGWPEILALGAATLVSLLAYAPPMMASLPHLRFRQAFVVTQASAASSYVLPGGPAVGMATSFAMLRGWGFTAAAATLAVAVTAVWLQFALLGLPAIGLALLALTGGRQAGVESAGLLGLAAFGVVLAMFTGALSSARLAQWAGDLAARVVSRALALVRRAPVTWTGDSFVAFRVRALGLLRRRWHALTIATVAQQLALFAVLLVSLRVLGVPDSQVNGVEAFAAWSLVRLLGALAITPGGIGVVELALTSLLVGFGGARAGTVAAVLVYRVLTIVPTIVLGLLAAATWRRHHRGALPTLP
jgi:putative heme transporter